MLKLIVSWVGIILSAIIIIIFVVWGFSLNVSDSAEIPVVKARVKEFRIIPDEPGGQIINYQGLSVNSVQEKGSAQIAANEIRLAPEPIKIENDEIFVRPAESTDKKPINPLEIPTENKEDPSSISENDAENLRAINVSVRPNTKEYIKLVIPEIREADPSEANNINKLEKVSLKPGTHFVELGSYKTKDKAIKVWSSLSKGNSIIFKNKEQLIEDASTHSSKSFKLRAIGFTNVIESRDFCDQLRDWGVICLPMRVR